MKSTNEFLHNVNQKLLQGKPLSVAMWDLECTSLSAMVGRILCCSFKELGRKPYTFRLDQSLYALADSTDDSGLATAIRDELEKYDIIVSHNGKLFDSKFLATRLLKVGERPREQRYHVDTMWTIRSNFKMSSKLDYAQQFIGLEDKKTPITWDDWQRAAASDIGGMDQVAKHCEADVRVLEGAYRKLRPYIKELKLG